MDPAVDNLIKAHQVLKKLDRPVTYVGGAVIPLYVIDPAAERPRPTEDVDTVIKTTTYAEYVHNQEKLRSIGLKESTDPDDPPCRWKYEGLKIDVMPVKGEFFGFDNKWYEEGVEHAEPRELTDEVTVQVFTPPYLFADKINAFRDRGDDDYYFSPDFEDMVRLVDGFPDFVSEIREANPDVQSYIREWVRDFLNQSGARDYIAAHVTQAERADILLERFHQLEELDLNQDPGGSEPG
jgi:hypothetical protein